MKKRIPGLAALIVLAVILFVSAGGQDTRSGTAATGGQVTKPREIFAVADTGFGDDSQVERIAQYFTEKTGIRLRVLKPPHNEYATKLNLQLFSGDVPDIMEVGSNDYLSYVSQDALFPMRDLIFSYRPFQQVDSSFFEALAVRGEIYGIQKEIGNGSVTYLRKDWLDKLGLQVPKTYNEFINVLRAFTNNDPDGNGRKDTVGYISASISNGYTQDFFQGAYMGFRKNAQGRWVDGMGEEVMYQALERMAAAYREGLIEPDIFTLSTADARTKFYSGGAGAFSYWAGAWAGTIDIELKRNNPNASVVAMPPVGNYKFFNRLAPIIALTVHGNAKNPRGVFEYMIKYMFDLGEGQTWATHGVEGFTYKFEGGNMVPLPSPQTPDVVPSQPGGGWLNSALRFTPFNDPFKVRADAAYTQQLFLDNSFTEQLVPPVTSFVRNEPDLRLLRAETIAKAMRGPQSVREVHDEYKTKARTYGVDETLRELNNY